MIPDPVPLPGNDPLYGERPCPMVDRMLHLAAARPDWRVGVLGPAAAATLIALCRKGFDRALAVRGVVCPGAEGDCDLLLITGPVDGAGLAAAVHAGLSLLRDGGVLVAHEGGLKDDGLIRAALRADGREVGWCVHDMADGCLVALQVLRMAAPVAADAQAA